MLSPVTWWREGRPLLPAAWMHDENLRLTRLARAVNRYHEWTRWVRPSWWLYVFAPYDSYWQWPWGRKSRITRPSVPEWKRPTWRRRRARNWWPTVIWCRLRGHPAGIVFYASYPATEPDYSCRNCGEEIG